MIHSTAKHFRSSLPLIFMLSMCVSLVSVCVDDSDGGGGVGVWTGYDPWRRGSVLGLITVTSLPNDKKKVGSLLVGVILSQVPYRFNIFSFP